MSEPAPQTRLDMFVIFDHPSDYPHDYVVVRQTATASGVERGQVWLRATLDEARLCVQYLHPGAYRMDRVADDDPAIVEVWL